MLSRGGCVHSLLSKEGGATLRQQATEKTVVAMRCHTRGFEKVFWPILAIVLTSVALVCFVVAAATPMWVQIRLFDTASATDPGKGYINFGIFSGSHVIELREDAFVDSDVDSYFVFERYTSILISRLYATFVFQVIAMILCVVLVILTFLNSYQTVTTWWRGPPMMYIVSVLTMFSAWMAAGLFADFYLWDMDTEALFVDSYTIPGSPNMFLYLLTYQRVPSLHYSFWLQVIGSLFPVMVLLISWRLMLLLSVGHKNKGGDEFEMQQMSEGVNSTMLPTNQMAMSMNAAARGPISPIPMGTMPMQPAGGKGFVTGEGGLLY